MYELQSAGGAFLTWRDADEQANWRMRSIHRTLSAARKARDRALTEMARRCGPGAHDNHYRIVLRARRPITLSAVWDCLPPWGHLPAEDCQGPIRTSVVWQPGEREPECPLPRDWDGQTCPACTDHAERIPA